jgi:hypothetical protein
LQIHKPDNINAPIRGYVINIERDRTEALKASIQAGECALGEL